MKSECKFFPLFAAHCMNYPLISTFKNVYYKHLILSPSAKLLQVSELSAVYSSKKIKVNVYCTRASEKDVTV